MLNKFSTTLSSAIISLMPVVFSEHALEQLKERGLSKKAVMDVVRDPDRILRSYKGRKLRQKMVGDTLVEAVTITEGSKITVITAYPLED